MSDEKPRKNREPNTPGSFGEVGVQTMGFFPDAEKFQGLLVHEASDMSLAEALAHRGYDVTARQPKLETLRNRRKKFEARKRRAAKAEGPGFDCADCGHTHAGSGYAFICIGCPCPRAVAP